MTNLPKLSARARKALDVLADGGYFRKQLERTYMGREQFVTRLRDANRCIVAGVGYKTLWELEIAGMIKRRPCLSSSVWPEEYVLNTAG